MKHEKMGPSTPKNAERGMLGGSPVHVNQNCDTHRRLIASARLLESDNAGERQAALQAVQRLLPVSIADVLASALRPAQRAPAGPSPVHWGQADRCLGVLDLTDWERGFLATIRRKPRISAKQRAILAPLYARSREAAL